MSAVARRIWRVAPSAHGVEVERKKSKKKTVMKLTRRGKAVFGGLGAALLLLFGMGVWNVGVAQSEPAIQQVTSYIVRPGDTLWSFAQRTTPNGEDVRETVADLITLNHLDSSAVEVGQRLVVPVE